MPAPPRHAQPGPWTLYEFDKLSSTQTWAMERAADLPHATLVQARHQTGGRGRFGRDWAAAPGASLTISVVLKPHPARGIPVTMAQATALCVRNALSTLGVNAMLKWPNDLMVNGRKLCGILAERDTESQAIVVGIGLNVNLDAPALSSAGLSDTATSMALVTGRRFNLDRVRDAVVSSLEPVVSRLATPDTTLLTPPLQDQWAAHDFLAGTDIAVDTHHGRLTGRYAGVGAEGALRLTDQKGYTHVVRAGDVTLCRLREDA